MSRYQRVLADYRTVGLSVEGHPMEFLREELSRHGVLSAEELEEAPAGREVAVAGLAIIRQRPSTARGVVFVTLEDETGFANGVVMPDVWEEQRRELRAPVLLLRGPVEREDGVVHVRVEEARGLRPGERIPVNERNFR
jgi:error-prone DNA polymerase